MTPEADLAWVLLAAPMLTSADLASKPCPVPAGPGVYAWWFNEIPEGVPTGSCIRRDGFVLLYVGISPKRRPANGRPPSRQTVRSRVRYHYRGNAEGSTLRLTLGLLLADRLGITLRRVGSGARRTFSAGERDLSQWMADHARVTLVEHPRPWELEEQLIRTLDLPLNLDQNGLHPFRAQLSALRSAAKASAAAQPVLPR